MNIGVIGKGTSKVFRTTLNIIKISLMIIGAMTVVACIAIGVLLWNFTRPTEIESRMHPVDITEEAVTSFDAKWDDFIEGIGDDESGEIAVAVTEEEISSKLTQEIANYKDEIGVPMDVEKVVVNFEPGSIHIIAAIEGTMMGLPVHVAAEGIIELREENGKKFLYYNIIEYNLGRGPSQLKDLAESAIGDNMEDTLEIPEEWDVQLMNIELEQVGDAYQLLINAAVLA